MCQWYCLELRTSVIIGQLTLFQTSREPFRINLVILASVFRLDREAVLDGDLTAILLADEGTHDGALVAAQVAACDVVGNLEDGQWV